MIYVCEACDIIFSNDQTDTCVQCGQKCIRDADDYEIANFIGSIFLDKGEVDSVCEKEKK